MKSLPVRGAWIEIRRECCAAMCAQSSLPVRGAWIEIGMYQTPAWRKEVSLPVRGAWIEMRRVVAHPDVDVSLPVRGAWIEMCNTPYVAISKSRSPCGERGLKSF